MFDFLLPIIIVVLFLLLYKSRLNAKKQAEVNIQAGKAFMQENAKSEDVTTTESGLQYKVLEKGTGTEHPVRTSKVKVHYHGTLVDGTVFDSSVARGEPIEFGLNQVIKGWTEGLQLMVVGEKARFFVPAELAYGNSAAGKIKPGSTLIFDVELLNFS